MAVSDLYVVQYLLDATRPGLSPLCWRQDGAGAWRATLNEVQISLFHTHTMGWSGLCLGLHGAEDAATYIQEPRPVSFFGRQYRCDDDLLLADSLHALSAAVSAQCAERQARALDSRDSIREVLFRRVVFGGP